jgi:two-component system sensor histidine kinase ChiS
MNINKNLKLLLLSLLFIMALVSLRLFYCSLFQPADHPLAENGILDLREQRLVDGWIKLNGEWEFYPYSFLPALTEESAAAGLRPERLAVPGGWRSAFADTDDSNYRYGTYRLQIQVDRGEAQRYALYMQTPPQAMDLYVNGHRLARVGEIAETPDRFAAQMATTFVGFELPEGEDHIEILIHTSADERLLRGGMTPIPIKFGSERAVSEFRTLSSALQAMMVILLLIYLGFSLMLNSLGARHRGIFFHILMILSGVGAVLLDRDKLLQYGFFLDMEWGIKLNHLFYGGIGAFVLLLAMELLPKNKNNRYLYAYLATLAVLVILRLLLPLHLYMDDITRKLELIFVSGTYLLVPIIVYRSILQGLKDYVFILLATISIFVSTAWGLISSSTQVEVYYYPFDFVIASFSFAAFWFKRFFQATSETKKLALRLQDEDKRKDEFLANTSHELRNPLHGIINIAQAVRENPNNTLEPKDRDNLDLLITVGRRMSSMLNDLLDVSRLKDSKIRLDLRAVSVASITAGVCDMLRFMTENKPVRLVQDIPDDFPPVHADENRLTQILFNLLHNAITYTDFGEVRLIVAYNREQAILRVRDTGVGMDQATMDRIFLPYEQGNGSQTGRSGGLGLGLHICQQLVELHGGRLNVRSSPGQGAEFSFTLPFSPSVPLLSAEEAAAAETRQLANERTKPDGTVGAERKTPGNGEIASASLDKADTFARKEEHGKNVARILAVDDDPVNLKILQNLLAEEDSSITPVSSGAEALKRLGETRFDLIIADVMMPLMSGYELTRAVRERFSLSELPVLLLTARNHPQDIGTGFGAGANDYVAKPVNALELKSRVRSLIATRRSFKEHLRMEAAWLQAQIQPHFLFNTLNTIGALSEIDTARMRQVLDAFSNYLRTGFDFQNLNSVVPIEHELMLVRSYLSIEQERFAERLEVSWHLDEPLLVELPPLTIQPLVENALKHGILKRSRGGKVEIAVRQDEREATVSIKDNGVGMEEALIRDVLNHSVANKAGVGLSNTDKRLKQLYDRGLTIISAPGQGTEVVFRIPIAEVGSREP